MAAKLRNTDTGPRDWWKTLKHFIKPNNTTSIPPLSKDDIVHTEEADKASLMNDFFVEQTILHESNATIAPNIDPPENNLNSISTSPHEVESILKSLQLGKASRLDEISNHILKKLATPLSRPLSNLFNFSLATGKVPLLWKEANVTPIFKKKKMILLSFLIIDLSLF